ncbi:MAG: hypothetical protein U9R00_02860 [Patescibacteria group bacterium]|nr:hypothetical protein [Patescibacteria group bacterium]
MVTNELIEYIKTQKENGVAENAIVVALTQAGWKDEDIQDGLKKSKPKPVPPDPYREPIEDVKKEEATDLKPETYQQVFPAEKKQEEFIPTLNKKPISNEEIVENKIEMPSKQMIPKKKNKKGLLSFFLIIILLGIIGTGAVYAYKNDLINLNFSFLRPSPEKAIKKVNESVKGIETAHYRGVIEFTPTIVDFPGNQLNNEFLGLLNTNMRTKVEGDIIKTGAKVPDFSVEGVISYLFTDRSNISYDGNLNFVNGTLYGKSPFLNNYTDYPNMWTYFAVNDSSMIESDSEGYVQLKYIYNKVVDDSRKLYIFDGVLASLQNVRLVTNLNELEDSAINGVPSYRYSFVIPKESFKPLINQLVDVFRIEFSTNISYLNRKAELLNDANVEIWINQKTFEPQKIILTIDSDEYEAGWNKIGSFEISATFLISDVNKSAVIEIPQNSISVYDLLNNLLTLPTQEEEEEE